MKKAIIITSYIEHLKMLHLSDKDYDFIISVDGGISFCEKLNFKPNLIIGDWDSSKNNPQTEIETISLSKEKDFTDTDAAVNYCLKNGYEDITVLGGLGGRFDHTMGAISLLTKKFWDFQAGIKILDGKNLVYMLKPGKYKIQRNDYKFFGLFSYSESCENLTVKGTKYTLDNFTLTNKTNIGVGNHIIENNATISFDKGTLLVVHSNE